MLAKFDGARIIGGTVPGGGGFTPTLDKGSAERSSLPSKISRPKATHVFLNAVFLRFRGLTIDLLISGSYLAGNSWGTASPIRGMGSRG
jgi:hypothetical protein